MSEYFAGDSRIWYEYSREHVPDFIYFPPHAEDSPSDDFEEDVVPSADDSDTIVPEDEDVVPSADDGPVAGEAGDL